MIEMSYSAMMPLPPAMGNISPRLNAAAPSTDDGNKDQTKKNKTKKVVAKVPPVLTRTAQVSLATFMTPIQPPLCMTRVKKTVSQHL